MFLRAGTAIMFCYIPVQPFCSYEWACWPSFYMNVRDRNEIFGGGHLLWCGTEILGSGLQILLAANCKS